VQFRVKYKTVRRRYSSVKRRLAGKMLQNGRCFLTSMGKPDRN